MRKLPACHHFERRSTDLLSMPIRLASKRQRDGLCALSGGHVLGGQRQLLAVRCRSIFAIGERHIVPGQSCGCIQHSGSHWVRILFCRHVPQHDQPKLFSMSARHNFHRCCAGVYILSIWVAGQCECDGLRALSGGHVPGGQRQLLAVPRWPILAISERNVLSDESCRRI